MGVVSYISVGRIMGNIQIGLVSGVGTIRVVSWDHSREGLVSGVGAIKIISQGHTERGGYS